MWTVYKLPHVLFIAVYWNIEQGEHYYQSSVVIGLVSCSQWMVKHGSRDSAVVVNFCTVLYLWIYLAPFPVDETIWGCSLLICCYTIQLYFMNNVWMYSCYGKVCGNVNWSNPHKALITKLEEKETTMVGQCQWRHNNNWGRNWILHNKEISRAHTHTLSLV